MGNAVRRTARPGHIILGMTESGHVIDQSDEVVSHGISAKRTMQERMDANGLALKHCLESH